MWTALAVTKSFVRLWFHGRHNRYSFPRLSWHERIKSAIKILRDGRISILDFMSTILDPSQLDFAVNRDRIYYSSKEEKENLKDESSRGKLEQVLDHMFADSRGRSRLLNWFHLHAVTYV